MGLVHMKTIIELNRLIQKLNSKKITIKHFLWRSRFIIFQILQILHFKT